MTMPADSPAKSIPFRIAIDGPAGSGKSTVARAVAEALGMTYVDTGAMYRAVGLRVSRLPEGANWGGEAEACDIAFRPAHGGQRVILDGEDITEAIRAPEISDWSSRVSEDPAVRAAMTRRQKETGSRESVVMEGRDIGTVVLPDAPLKVFLTASEDERARRRLRDLELRGRKATLEEVRREIRERDQRDSTRDAAPLRKADDAVEVNTDGMTIDEVVGRILALARERGARG